jgi:hypothetical protein
VYNSEAVAVAAEAWGQFGNPKENERLLLEVSKTLPSNGSEDVNVETNPCA